MRKIQCESCPSRGQGGQGLICDLPAQALDDFRAVGAAVLYRPRQVIFSEGTPSTGLYLLCHGAVKLYHADRFGREHILQVAAPGAILGELTLDDETALSVSAEALTDVQIRLLPRERLVSFLQTHPDVGVRLLVALSSELAAARAKVRDLALKGAENRLAGLLLQLAHAEGGVAADGRLHLRYTRRELAEMIGVSTETAIRLLSKLKRQHLLSINGRDVVIEDAAKLRSLAAHTDTELDPA